VPVTPPRRTEAVQVGLDIYARATAFGAQPDQAAAEAIAAAIRTHETAVLNRISRAADLVAASLRAQRGGRYSIDAAALRTFANNHVTPLPTTVDESDYRPTAGDLVEVTLTGPALTSDTVAVWVLADEVTGRWFRFAAPGADTAPNLRVLDVASSGWPDTGGRPPRSTDR
jgi:hypothetical protein